jgi:hypothetical protein
LILKIIFKHYRQAEFSGCEKKSPRSSQRSGSSSTVTIEHRRADHGALLGRRARDQRRSAALHARTSSRLAVAAGDRALLGLPLLLI